MTTRDRIIDAATRLLDEGGVAAVTLRAVGDRVGLSRAAPYKHFTDKTDLLASVAAAELDRLADTMRTAAERADGGHAGRVEAAAVTYVRWARSRPTRFRLVFGAWGDEPHEALGRSADAASELLYGLVREAVADGALTGDADRLAPMIWSLGHGAVDLDLAGHLSKKPGAPSAEQLVADLVRLVRA